MNRRSCNKQDGRWELAPQVILWPWLHTLSCVLALIHVHANMRSPKEYFFKCEKLTLIILKEFLAWYKNKYPMILSLKAGNIMNTRANYEDLIEWKTVSKWTWIRRKGGATSETEHWWAHQKAIALQKRFLSTLGGQTRGWWLIPNSFQNPWTNKYSLLEDERHVWVSTHAKKAHTNALSP